MALGRPGSALGAKNGPVPSGWRVEIPQFKKSTEPRRTKAKSQAHLQNKETGNSLQVVRSPSPRNWRSVNKQLRQSTSSTYPGSSSNKSLSTRPSKPLPPWPRSYWRSLRLRQGRNRETCPWIHGPRVSKALSREDRHTARPRRLRYEVNHE